MFHLYSFDSPEYLLHLIRFSFSIRILNINHRVPWIWSLIYPVAGMRLTRIPEIKIAHFAQISEPDVLRITFHPGYDVSDLCHAIIVSLLVLFVNGIRLTHSIGSFVL